MDQGRGQCQNSMEELEPCCILIRKEGGRTKGNLFEVDSVYF